MPFIDNPSAYMLLQDNIEFGKPPPFVWMGGGGNEFTMKNYPRCNDCVFTQQAFFPAVDGGGSFLITAGLPSALFLFFT